MASDSEVVILIPSAHLPQWLLEVPAWRSKKDHWSWLHWEILSMKRSPGRTAQEWVWLTANNVNKALAVTVIPLLPYYPEVPATGYHNVHGHEPSFSESTKHMKTDWTNSHKFSSILGQVKSWTSVSQSGHRIIIQGIIHAVSSFNWTKCWKDAIEPSLYDN